MIRSGPAATATRLLLGGVAYLVVIDLAFGLSLPNLVNGLALGSLYGIVGVAIILIYRTSKLINFSAAAIGGVPAITALLLVIQKGQNYLAMLPLAAFGGLLVGALTDRLVMRRFTKAPRLLVIVVTIGLAQSFAALGFFIPVWMGAKASQIPTVPTPWANLALRNHRGQPILSGNQAFAFVIVIGLTVALSLFLRRARYGIALRAAAENSDRAQLLGIPVERINTAAWSIAGLLASLAIYAQAPLIGVPSDATLGFDALLFGLAAAVVARMERFGLALYTGMGIGVLIFTSVASTGTYDYAAALMLVVILVALLLQRRARGRAHDTGVSSFQAVRTFRTVPIELRSLPEVVAGRTLLAAAAVATAALLPILVGSTYVPTLTVLPLYGIAAVSLVILTGWAGQISLGQFGLIGIGAASAGGLAANHNIDFFLAIAIGVAAGAATAVIVGLPAMRLQGLYLAVTTLAFGFAMQTYVLNPNYWLGHHLLPSGLADHLVRPVLYGRIDLENDRSFYYVCVAFLGLTMVLAKALRTYRGGRVIMAVRDNERAASSYTIHPARTRLSAFAISGALAGLAGVLFAYQQHNVIPGTFSVQASIFLFLAASVAGLSTINSCVIGVMGFEALVLFGPHAWHHLGTTFSSVVPLLITGPLLILSLYLNPGGLAQQVFTIRDHFLRWVCQRRGLPSPSIVDERTNARPVGDLAPDTSTVVVASGSSLPSLLQCRNVSLGYDKVQVLFGVDLDIREGEIVALLGTNGAGKSTLLRAVSGLSEISSGKVLFDNVDITNASPITTARMGIVHVPGGRAVFPTLTVAEHFSTSSWLDPSADPEVTKARTEHILDVFPRLRERWGQLGGDLSGGEQQQLALAMAFVAKPRLLIIDELSLGLAPTIVRQLLDIVRKIHADGASVLLVEQSVNLALTIADRAYFLDKGEVRFSGPTQQLLSRPDILRSVFLKSIEDDTAAGDLSVGSSPSGVNGSATVLDVRGLSKRFGGIQAVTDVSLTLHTKEILGLIGPNGAGKTTIFDLLCGHLVADSGQVLLSDTNVTTWAPHQRASVGLGRSFQDARIFPTLTVSDNIAVALERHIAVRDHVSALFATPAMRASEADVEFTVNDLIELLGLGDYRNKFVAELSTGSRRIVELAMAIAHDPVVLLLDEPSSGIAQRETERLGPLLLDIRRETGCAMLIIEHDMNLISSVCDEIIALDLGMVVTQGRPQSVLNHPHVVASYLGTDVATIERSGPRTQRPRRHVNVG